MKKLTFLFALLLISSSAMYAQVGFNTDNAQPHHSAGLDVNFSNKGLLIPRVALTANNVEGPIPGPETSLLVYNTATAGTSPYNVIPGYYYWNGNAWVRLSVASGGTGTANYVTKWTASGSLGNSQIFDNGNVGIGTTSPSAPLQVKANGIASPSSNGLYVFNPTNSSGQHAIICAGVGGANAGNPYFSLRSYYESGWSMGMDNLDNSFKFSTAWDNLTSQTKMTLLSNGNVGIGTASPSSMLDVNGNIGLHDGALFLRYGGADVSHGMIFNSGVDGPEFRGFGGFVWKNGAAGTTELMRLNSTGLGIGTQNPNAKLHVSAPTTTAASLTWGATAGTIFRSQNSELAMGLNDTDPWAYWLQARTHISGARDIALQPLGGNVGIGTASPTAKLDVVGTIKAQDFKAQGEEGFRFFDNNGSGYLKIRNVGNSLITSNNGSAETSVIFTGWVGINNRTPEYPLDVGGSVWRSWGSSYYGYHNNAGQSGICQTCQGNFSIRSDGRVLAEEFDAISDRRIKDIIGISDTKKDLELIQGLKVTQYRYIDKVQKGNSLKQGFIAQQVEEVIPEAVTRSSNFIPDIYAISANVEYNEAQKELKIVLDKTHGLAVSDLVRVYSGNEMVDKTVSGINSEKEFILSDWETGTDSLFIYGKKVDDFRALDYDRIFTVGIGAIQELAKQLKEAQATIEAMEKEKMAMQAQIDRINAYLELSSQK